MFELIDPQVYNVIFAAVGAAVGWWVRRQQGNAGGVPDEVAAIVKALLERKKQQEAHALLEDLVGAIRQSKTPGGE